MTEPFLYVVLSATPTRTGAFIRRYTRNSFNHISISFDSKLEPLYSFARHFYSTPFYGGFVKESLSRYHLKGSAAHLRVFRIPVSQEQLAQLHRHIDYMLSRQDQYLYNHLSALAVPFRKTVKTSDSYTCVEFCVEILHSIGLSVTPGKFYSLRQLVFVMCNCRSKASAVVTGGCKEIIIIHSWIIRIYWFDIFGYSHFDSSSLYNITVSNSSSNSKY